MEAAIDSPVEVEGGHRLTCQGGRRPSTHLSKWKAAIDSPVEVEGGNRLTCPGGKRLFRHYVAQSQRNRSDLDGFLARVRT